MSPRPLRCVAWLALGGLLGLRAVLPSSQCPAGLVFSSGVAAHGSLIHPQPLHLPSAWQMLFDSSRFNYDSDEDEEQGTTSTEAAQEEQQGTAATAAAGAAAQQQRRAAFRAAASEAGVTVDDGSAAPVDIVLPPPRGTAVKTAEFIKSSVTVEQCPPARFPEFAGAAGEVGWHGG